MRAFVDTFAPETDDEAEWVIAGWVLAKLTKVWSARLELDGEPLGPISIGWASPSSTLGFRGHVLLPAMLPGPHTLEIVFSDLSGSETGRWRHVFTTTKHITTAPASGVAPGVRPGPHSAYLDLLEKTLLGLPYLEREQLLAREEGRDPIDAAQLANCHTLIGHKRLRNLRVCAETALQTNVPGDFMETGVWRGGACILMAAVLRAHDDKTRCVWAADSFEGLPRPNETQYPADAGDTFYKFEELAVSLEQVQEHFRRYDLLDDRVKFLKGWFSQTLPDAPTKQLAVLRLDGDMYESTMDALTHLYPKLSPGGFCIVDDYGAIKACRQAVRDYRSRIGSREPTTMVDWTGAWWRKE